MKYRIIKKHSKNAAEIRTTFYIEKEVKTPLWIRILAGAPKFDWKILREQYFIGEEVFPSYKDMVFHTEKEAEEHVDYMCRRDNLVVPEDEILKEYNCEPIVE